jgi:hypothetical protein
MNKNNLIQSTLIGAAIAVVFIVVITIAGELYKVVGPDGKAMINPIKDFLKALHGHHWVGKGVWAVGLFILSTGIMYLVGRKDGEERRLDSYVSMLSYVLIFGTVALFGFFTYEYMIH